MWGDNVRVGLSLGQFGWGFALAVGTFAHDRDEVVKEGFRAYRGGEGGCSRLGWGRHGWCLVRFLVPKCVALV